jgi:hypothetical protein
MVIHSVSIPVVITANALVRGRNGAKELREPGLLVVNQRFRYAKLFITIALRIKTVVAVQV